MTLLEQAQAATGYSIDGATLEAAGRWVAGALVAVGGFFVLVFKWLMDRVSKSQDSLTSAVASLEKAVGSFDRREAEEREARNRLADGQAQILAELRRKGAA